MADKPSAEELYGLADDTIAEYATRDTIFDELERYYFLELDKEDKAALEEGVEVVHLPYASNAIDLVQDLVVDAALTLAVPAMATGPTAKQFADTAEKYILSIIQQSERAQKQILLARASWLAAMRGCVAGRVMAIPKWLSKTEDGTWEAGQRVPLLLQLRDPRYVYPAFGLDGLSFVIERRTRTVRDLRNSLGDDVLPNKKLKDTVIWTEYWDDTWFCYWADGKPVALSAGAGPWPHRYGGIPYAFDFARQTAKTAPDKRVRPLLKSVQSVIDRLALLDSAEATFLMQYAGDSLMVSAEGEPPIDLRPGSINYLEPDDKVNWLYGSRQPVEFQLAHGKYSAQLQKGTFPDAMYGMDPGRVMAGYALNLLNQAGQLRLKPIVACLERFLQDLFENVLMVSEHYLTDLIGGAIPFYLTGDREAEDGARLRTREENKLDAKKFDGWYEVEVTLGDLMPADQQANLILALKSREVGPDGRPMLSWETAVEEYGLTASPGDERERIDREMAMNDPVVQILNQALYVAQIKQELGDELLKLDIDPDEVLAMAQGMGQGPSQPPQMMQAPQPSGVPAEVLPPEMQGELMPQPGLDEGGLPMPPAPRRRF